MRLQEIKSRPARAGIIPWYDNMMMFMIPSDHNYGGPMPQIAKGHIDPGHSIESTALKEGHEELGLKTGNIIELRGPVKEWQPLKHGGYDISVFAAKIKDPKDFDKPGFETGEIVWVAMEDLHLLRQTQQHIVKEVIRKLIRII